VEVGVGKNVFLAASVFVLAGCAAAPEPAPAVAPVKRAAPIAAAKAPVEAPAPPKRSVDLDVRDASLTSVIESVAQQVGVPMVLRGESDDKVTLSLHACPWRDVLAYLARAYKLRVREDRGLVVVEVPVRTTVQATAAAPATWFQLLAKQGDRSIIMPGHLEGQIDADLKDVDFIEALVATARANGYEVVDGRGSLVLVGK
jgi:hypothetical protein